MKSKKCAFEYAGQAGDLTPLFSKAGSRVAYVTSGHDGCYTRLLTAQGCVVGLGLALASNDVLNDFNLSDDLYLNSGERL